MCCDLPVDADGKVLEDGDGMTIIGEIEDIEIGATEQVALDLDAGKYLLICNILQTEPDGIAGVALHDGDEHRVRGHRSVIA